MRHAMRLLVAFVAGLVVMTQVGAAQPMKSPSPPPAQPPIPSPGPVTWKVRIESISDDKASLLVKERTQSIGLSVKAKELQTRLKEFHPGDMVVVEVAGEVDQRVLTGLSPQAVSIDRRRRVWVLFFSGLGVLIFSGIVLGRRLPMLVVGEDQRYSNSKFQMATWFGLVVVAYVATVWLRWREGGGQFIGGVNLPQNLLVLSGISAFTFAAAKGITKANVDANPAVKPPAASPRFPTDLLCNDQGQPDVGDFQMLVITLLAVGVYLLQVFAFLGSIELLKVVTIPDVDTTILATFGLGQGAYLTKKYAGRGTA